MTIKNKINQNQESFDPKICQAINATDIIFRIFVIMSSVNNE